MNPNITVVKFGGTSLADAKQFVKVADIVKSDPRRKYVIVSAPGKRFSDDIKITDLLIKCYDNRDNDLLSETFNIISERFRDIATELGLDIDISRDIDIITNNIENGAPFAYLLSRGEYINAKIMAAYLNFPFVDAADLIFFDKNGHLDTEKTYSTIKKKLSAYEHAVIPGFYGSMPNGTINTFPRGGSDITGSVVARGVEAHLYENWTDVSGFMMADPRIIPDARCIDILTYRELRELSYMGATVLQEDAVFPVKELGIPINVKNTNDVDAKGTIIVDSVPDSADHTVTGLAGRKGFSVLLIEKILMNNHIGYMRKVLSIFEKYNISVEHIPTGIDTMSVVFEKAKTTPETIKKITAEINSELDPDRIIHTDNIALVAVAGRNMVNRSGTAGKILTELGKSGINIMLLAQSSNELTIIVGVDSKHYEKTIRILYDLFKY